MIGLSIILPVTKLAPPTLLIQGLVEQMGSRDELLIVGDGPRPEARKAFSDLDPRVMYFEFGPTRAWGHPQRNAALRLCTRDYLFALAEEDQVVPGALQTIRDVVAENPNRPLLFRMRCADQIIWRAQEYAEDNIMGQIFIAPNIKGRLGRWGRRRGGCLDFFLSTIRWYRQPPFILNWRKEVLTITPHSVSASKVPL